MKHLLFLTIILIACEGPNRSNGISKIQADDSAHSDSLSKFMEEIGINPKLVNKQWEITQGFPDLDQKFKNFLEKYKGQDFSEKRSAIDRATRIVLFDMAYIHPKSNADKEITDFYVHEYLKNGGFNPEALIGIVHYVKKENGMNDKKIYKLTWALNKSLDFNIENFEKNIKSNIFKMNSDTRYKPLFEPDNVMMQEQLVQYQKIKNEIKDWPKIALKNSFHNGFDYSEILD